MNIDAQAETLAAQDHRKQHRDLMDWELGGWRKSGLASLMHEPILFDCDTVRLDSGDRQPKKIA